MPHGRAWPRTGSQGPSTRPSESLEDARSQAESQLKEARVQAREELLQQRAEQERELAERRAEVVKVEERVISKEEQLQDSLEELARRDQSISDRETHARQMQEELKTVKEQQVAELERIAGLSQAQARDALMSQTEEHVRHDMAKLVRQIEEEAKVEADRRARNILSVGDPADRVVPHRRDDGLGRPAAVGRSEGPDHRPRGAEHPRAREPDRRRRDHRRHAPGGRALRVRRRPPGDGQADAREADRRRAHPPVADRGDVLPVEGGDRGGDRPPRRAGEFEANVPACTWS